MKQPKSYQAQLG